MLLVWQTYRAAINILPKRKRININAHGILTRRQKITHLSPLSECTLNKIRPYEEQTLTNHHNKIYYVRQIVPICVWRVYLVPCYSSNSRINSFMGSRFRSRFTRNTLTFLRLLQLRLRIVFYNPATARVLFWHSPLQSDRLPLVYPGHTHSCWGLRISSWVAVWWLYNTRYGRCDNKVATCPLKRCVCVRVCGRVVLPPT